MFPGGDSNEKEPAMIAKSLLLIDLLYLRLAPSRNINSREVKNLPFVTLVLAFGTVLASRAYQLRGSRGCVTWSLLLKLSGPQFPHP